MPILNVLLSGPAQEQKTQQVAQMLGEFTSRILRKKPELTSIAIRYVEPEHWIVGGQSLAAQNKSSAFVEIKITDETNTRLEKAAYIQAVYDGLLNLMPDLHHESYIHVDDVRAGAYGYGGKTQEYRAHQT
ncbi:tautomerase family protein [Macromonas nakdongensis]|jgi:4-oxalocrotonate tautomerase|uniref:tautomerase family protein n=1 Tax=Macromonas nakdongensis TaxID=1843082 RepID=UPI000C343360|nr:4-oxalocrotonate tautomerase family protein [Macromonas nakdongensis]